MLEFHMLLKDLTVYKKEYARPYHAICHIVHHKVNKLGH